MIGGGSSASPVSLKALAMTVANDHLSEIQTLWSVVQRAHVGEADAIRTAQEQLLGTYGGAIRRYLLGAFRSEDAADEVFQEFSLRFLRGDFRGVTPDRGRFRSFLKTCLYHLIVDHQRRQKRAANRAAGDAGELAVAAIESNDSAADQAFLQSWREELLARAWRRLEEDERETGKPYHSVLQAKAKHPELSSTDLASVVSDALQREITSANVRVLLHRARELFAECLLRAVTDSLSDSRREQVEEELIELQLLEYCRAALQRTEA